MRVLSSIPLRQEYHKAQCLILCSRIWCTMVICPSHVKRGHDNRFGKWSSRCETIWRCGRVRYWNHQHLVDQKMQADLITNRRKRNTISILLQNNFKWDSLYYSGNGPNGHSDKWVINSIWEKGMNISGKGTEYRRMYTEYRRMDNSPYCPECGYIFLFCLERRSLEDSLKINLSSHNIVGETLKSEANRCAVNSVRERMGNRNMPNRREVRRASSLKTQSSSWTY